MKKYFLSIVALVVCATAFAKDPIKIVSGNISAIAKKTVYVQLDPKDAIIVDEDTKEEMSIEEFCQKMGEDWIADMGKDDIEAVEQITHTLSKKTKKISVTENKSEANIILVVKPNVFSYGNPFAFSAFMSNDTNGFFIGEFMFNTPNGENIATLSCEKITGTDTVWTWTKQKRHVYDLVTKKLAQFINSKVK